ncbi:mitochondrial 54S ribosomal protein mL58 [Aspergillus tanneri]|uniref:Uncharacterized protein n=1 Tax=Aspergillus tanneri TaxID=1220188 RepID=A0A5M9MJL2_9EURO|nr:uncharacterized protein ATNIH1004_006939 [Aspergillus tanneri]KAA8645520.1 hypothetical protein ATNIH1004_006939 [Aspergillus tanneri]
MDDARRALRAGIDMKHNISEDLPPVFQSSTEKKYHLNPSDIEEIRRLRLSDPMMWSRWKLAKRFDCSPVFVAMCNRDGAQNVEWLEKTANYGKSLGGALNKREGGLLHSLYLQLYSIRWCSL